MDNKKSGKIMLAAAGILAIIFSGWALVIAVMAQLHDYALSSSLGLLFAVASLAAGIVGLKNRGKCSKEAMVMGCFTAGLASLVWLLWFITDTVTFGIEYISFLTEAQFLVPQVLLILGAVLNNRGAA